VPLRGPEKGRLNKAVAAATALSSSPVCFSCFLFYKNTCICPLLSGTAGYAGAYLAYPVDPPLGAPGGGQSKPTEPDTQRVRTKQLDDAQSFFGSTTTPRSFYAAARPS